MIPECTPVTRDTDFSHTMGEAINGKIVVLIVKGDEMVALNFRHDAIAFTGGREGLYFHTKGFNLRDWEYKNSFEKSFIRWEQIDSGEYQVYLMELKSNTETFMKEGE